MYWKSRCFQRIIIIFLSCIANKYFLKFLKLTLGVNKCNKKTILNNRNVVCQLKIHTVYIETTRMLWSKYLVSYSSCPSVVEKNNYGQ